MLSEREVGAERSLRHWARVFHRGAARQKLLGMFTAYFDESGIHGDAQICVMAAYLAPEKEWQRFIPKWQKVLDDNGIGVFHANHCNGNKGEFRKFKDKREERNRFVADLLKTISDRPRIIPFISGIVVKGDTDNYRRMADVLEFRHPYYFGLMAVMVQIGSYMDKIMKYPPREKVACIFDRQQEFSGFAVSVFNKIVESQLDWAGKERFNSIGFGSMDADIPLQAADALAYDGYRDFCRRKYHPERQPRPSFPILSKGVRGFLIDESQMENFLTQYRATA